jgi:chaperonin GroEL
MKITDALLNKTHQDVVFGDKGQKELLKGAEILYRAVKSTMGPSGHNVIIDNGISQPFITKDGVTVAKNINLKNHLQNIGAGLVKEVALKTNELGGDGPQPLYSKILTPTGWKTMGDIKIGDTICGTNNTFQKVLGIYPKGKKEIYTVEFSEGQKVKCCEDHLWTVVDLNGNSFTLPTKLLAAKPFNWFVKSSKVKIEKRFFTKKSLKFQKTYLNKTFIQIKSIKATGLFTEMQCIKVSNSDSLYITDDFIPTHNTTTATVLAYNLFSNGYKFSSAGRNAILLKKGIDWATDKVISRLKEVSTQVRNDEDIISIGTISANGDREIGKLLCEAIKKVGEDGIITVEKAKSVKTTLSVVDGLSLDSGYISPFFVTNQEKLTSDLEKPFILVTNKKISTKEQLIPVMSIANEKSRPLLIIADEIEQEPLHMLLTNKMHGAVISCAIKAPSYGDNRIDILHDICLVTGATCFDAAQSIQLEKLKEEHLGSCEKITVSKTLTTLFGLGENVTKEQIDNRIKELKQVLSTPVDGLDDLKRNNIKKRLAKLAGGIAVIHVGGSTEVEIIEKKDRVDDALNATQAAVQEGILPGGGTALFYCAEFLNEKILKNEDSLSEDEIFGARVVYEACKAPLKVIVENTGKNPEVIMDHILRNSDSINYGYNAFTHTYQNLIDNGVIDPVKVTRYAFEFASSVVGLMLTCNCVIMTPEEERSEKEE